MRSIFSTLTGLLSGQALLNLGNGLFATLLALRMVLDGFAVGAIGLVLAAYYVGFVTATVTAHRIIGRVGHIRAFAAFAAIASASPLVHPLLVSVPSWMLLRAATGFCLAALFMISESWLNARAPNARRGRVLSLYMVVFYLSLGCGQFLIGLGDPSENMLFSVVSILISLSLVPVVLTRAEAPVIAAPQRLGFRRLVSVSPLAVAVAGSAGLVSGGFLTMGPVFATGSGMTPGATGVFMGIAVLSGLALQWPLGWLSDRIDRRTVVTAIAFASAAASIALAGAGAFAVGALPILAAVYGGLTFPLYAQAVAHANDYAETDQFITVSAGLLLAAGTGSAAAPLIAGAMMGALGPAGLFLYTAAVMVALGAFTLYRMRAREPLPVDEQTPFAPVTPTTPVAAGLDPRQEDGEPELPFAAELSGDADEPQTERDGA